MKIVLNREEWRAQCVSELLKLSAIYGKKSVNDVIEDTKQIENYVFKDNIIIEVKSEDQRKAINDLINSFN